jgi:UDP-N-acetylmuramoyl-L-alanyl-D-glutamate--2,6-diaminopimelate ligase
MVKSIAEAAGKKVGLIGTIKNMIGQKDIHTERTTPESVDLHRLLREMADGGCDAAVMEVSSHSLLLKRVYGMDFDNGIFSNLTQDHLDFHQTWENYVEAKSMLFQQSRISVVNIDDDSAANMISAAKHEVIEYSVAHPSEFMAKNVDISSKGVAYSVELGAGKLDIHVPIPGLFTVYNSLAAAVACYAMGIDGVYIKKGLSDMKAVPGRFELLDVRGQGFSVILDYSHTPDSLENALLTIKEFAKGRVITVFGCGGNRDAGKRPVMGRVAAKYSDYVVITSDNPRFEQPEAIIDQIEEGVAGRNVRYVKIENRKKAMAHAIKSARKDDIILLAGKGHETYQEIRGVKHDFDEKVVVGEILDEMGIR